MCSSPSQCKETIRLLALDAGFEACGFAEACPVAAPAVAAYDRWTAAGRHFSMGYLENHREVRNDPRLLLDGAKTVICLALNYYPSTLQPANAPQFAYYAYGRDYHDTVRRLLTPVTDFLTETCGAACRVCVDSAPIRERYWAQQAGIGFVGRNNQLILPGKGSYFFLCEIVTTLALPPDVPASGNCGDCHLCVDACPAKALPGDYSALDARCCLSCLTIEHRGDLPEKTAEKLGKRVYGCDACQKACPHNRNARPNHIADFQPSEEFLSLSFESMARMTIDDFRRIFKGSAVKRTKYEGLMRNLKAATTHPDKKRE